MWTCIAWEFGYPHIEGLGEFLQLTRETQVARGDDQSFALRNIVAKLVCPAREPQRLRRLIEIVVTGGQSCIGHREIRIQFNCPRKKWNARRVAFGYQNPEAFGVAFERLE